MYLPQKFYQLPQHQQVWTQQLLRYIQQTNNPNQLAIGQIAHQFKMSERQFYRRVKQNLAITPNQLIRQIKMDKAKHLLEQGVHATIAEVAYNLGYKRPEYFSNVFRQTFGIRPSHFLKNR